jgi:hypothetical protein
MIPQFLDLFFFVSGRPAYPVNTTAFYYYSSEDGVNLEVAIPPNVLS